MFPIVKPLVRRAGSILVLTLMLCVGLAIADRDETNLALRGTDLPSQSDAPRGRVTCPEPQASQFDFWLGTWDIANLQRLPSRPSDPTWLPTGTFRTQVDAIMGGCLIVEQSIGELVYGPVSGFSLRAFDPVQESWVVVNNWSVGGAPPGFSTWRGTFHHGRIEGFDVSPAAVSAAENLPITRSTFSDISDSTFRWDSASSSDGMLTWKPTWIMEGRRVNPDAEEKPRAEDTPAPDLSRLCTDDVRTAVDSLLGTWRGTVAHSGRSDLPSGSAVMLRANAIHGGCGFAAMMSIADKTPEFQRALVRGFDRGSGRWVQFSFDAQTRTFERLDGMSTRLFTRVGIAGQIPTDLRQHWDLRPDGELTLREEAKPNSDGTWPLAFEIKFHR